MPPSGRSPAGGRAGFRATQVALLLVPVVACTSEVLFHDEGAVTEVGLSGRVVSWRNSATVVPNATVVTVGIFPAIQVTANATGDFRMEGVPAQGVVTLRVVADGYADTVSSPIFVGSESVEALFLTAIPDADAASFGGSFPVVHSTGGAILGRVLGQSGDPLAGIRDLRVLPDTMVHSSAYFLSVARNPAPTASATTSSGEFVFLNVTTGNLIVQVADPDGTVFSSVATTVLPGAWSLVDLSAEPPPTEPEPGDSPTPTPTPTLVPGPTPTPDEAISFKDDLQNIFKKTIAQGGRGCVDCHKQNQPGHLEGGLKIDGNTPCNTLHQRFVTDVSPNTGTRRVDLTYPDRSLLLTRPSPGGQPPHPNANFPQGPYDVDYNRIWSWIVLGAENDC